MRIKQQSAVLLALLILSGTLGAVEVAPFDATSLRQKGMGGVSVATSFDESAIFRNPAGIAYAKPNFKLFRLGVDYSNSFADSYDKLKELNNDDATTETQLDVLKELVPFRGSVKQSVAPGLSLTFPGIGIGVYSSSHLATNVLRRTSPVIEVEGFTDVVPGIALGREFNIFGPLAMGVSVKYIYRNTIYDKSTGNDGIRYTSSEALTLFNDLDGKKEPGYYTASGLGVDFGIMRPFRSRWFNRGTIGISVQNISNKLTGTQEIQTVSNSVTTTREQDVERELPMIGTLGIGLHEFDLLRKIPVIGFIFGTMEVGMDYKFISPDDNFGKNLNLGVEKKILWNAVKLRGGINQGYFVGGAGLDLKIWKIPLLHLNYAQYTEETGEKAGQRPMQFQSFEVGVLF